MDTEIRISYNVCMHVIKYFLVVFNHVKIQKNVFSPLAMKKTGTCFVEPSALSPRFPEDAWNPREPRDTKLRENVAII